jgi:hypothetical protein
MILQNLAEYYENLVLQEKVSKSGWCQAKVSHAIELNEDGTIKAIISKRKEEEREKNMGSCIIKCSGNGYKVVRSIFQFFV